MKFLIHVGPYFEDCSESYRYHCDVAAYANYSRTEIGQNAVCCKVQKLESQS